MAAKDGKREVRIYNVIQGVLEHLIKGNAVQDDTVLHRFFDSIKQSCTTVEDVESSQILQYVLKICQNYESLPSSTVVFGLHLAGWLGETSDFFQQFKGAVQQAFSSMSEKMQSSGIADISILTAFYQSLSQLTRHKEGLKWIITDKIMKEISMEGLDILKISPSVFLEKAVIEYLASVVKESELLEKVTEEDTFSAAVIRRAINNFKSQQNVIEARPFVTPSLKLIEKLCVQSQMCVELLVRNHADFCEYIIQKIYTAQGVRLDAVLTIIGALLDFEKVRNKTLGECYVMTYFALGVGDHLTRLCQEGNVCNAQRLALCCLRNDSLENEELKLRCSTLLTQPIYFVFGEEIEPAVIPPYVLIAEMSTQMKCTDTVCRCLDWKFIDIKYVMRLLRTTVFADDEIVVPKVAGCLLKNTVVQRKCLEFLNDDPTHLVEAVDAHIATTDTVLLLFKEPDNEAVVYSLCSKLLWSLLPTVFAGAESAYLTEKLAEIVQHHLSAMTWELRDTTLEFLAKFIEQQQGNQAVVDWVLKHGLHSQVWQCLRDSESYVRATAVGALYEVFCCSRLWAGLLQSLHRDEVEALQAILDIVETDTEAFARRAAVTFLDKYCKAKVSQDVKERSPVVVKVMETMLKATRDLDWEVKIIGIECINSVVSKDLQHALSLVASSASQNTDNPGENMAASGFILGDEMVLQLAYAVKQALDDCDEKVCEKALDLISSLQSSLESIIQKESGGIVDTSPSRKKRDKATRDQEAVIKCKRLKRAPAKNWTVPKLFTAMKVGMDVQKNEMNEQSSVGKMLDVVCTVLNIDLSLTAAKIEEINDGTSDLISLAEDILASAHQRDLEENVVDCY